MLVDASIARSFAVIGWTRHLLQLTGGTILVADTVHGLDAEDRSELRRIQTALQRQADEAGFGSGRAGRALAAVHGLDQLLALTPTELTVLTLNDDELQLAVRLQSRRPEDRAWRHSLGAKARRLDAGESASIAIAVTRSLGYGLRQRRRRRPHPLGGAVRCPGPADPRPTSGARGRRCCR